MHVDEENGQSAKTRLPVIERARQPRLLGRTAAPHTGRQPISCVCIWRAMATRCFATANMAQGWRFLDRARSAQDAFATRGGCGSSNPDGHNLDVKRRIANPFCDNR